MDAIRDKKLLYGPCRTFENSDLTSLAPNLARSPSYAKLRVVSDQRGSFYEVERRVIQSPITDQFLIVNLGQALWSQALAVPGRQGRIIVCSHPAARLVVEILGAHREASFPAGWQDSRVHRFGGQMPLARPEPPLSGI